MLAFIGLNLAMPATASSRFESDRFGVENSDYLSFSDVVLKELGKRTDSSRRGVFAVGDVHGDIKLVTVAWAEGIQAAIYAFKEITSPYWLNEKRLRDHKVALIGEKIAEAATSKRRSR